VTGGTLGIGKAIVEECSQLGATVLTCSRNAKNMEESIKEWEKKGLRNIHGCLADVSTTSGRDSLIEIMKQLFSSDEVSLDGLVNNVGTNIRKRAIEYSEEEYEKIMNTNLHSTFRLTKALYPYLRKISKDDLNQKGASVINMASVSGGVNTSMRSGIVYGMTKAAMTQMTFNLSCEWALDGIRVNAIAPWYIATPLTKPFLANPEILNTVIDRTPMRRIGAPEEVSSTVAFLLMDSTAYVSGQVIAVDGAFLRNGFY
jgi:Tropinone reductase 1